MRTSSIKPENKEVGSRSFEAPIFKPLSEGIIPNSSKLPYEAIESFTPIDAGTNKVNVKLYDGHAGELSKNCTPLEEVEVQVQPTDESNNDDRIEFKVTMDAEGLVHIDVRDKLRNKPVPIKLKFHIGLSDGEVQEERKRFLARHEKSEDQTLRE